jgi:uncharacterized protein
MDWVLIQCQTLVQGEQGFYVALLMAGLFGSVTHCVGMCGPLVVGQVSARMDGLPVHDMSELKRLQGALLLPYHAGRVSTYVLCGMVAALIMAQVKSIAWFKYISAVMLVCAAGVFLAAALRVSIPSFGKMVVLKRMFGCLPANVLHWFSSCAKSLSSAPVGVKGYGLGMLLGFMPCGLVYGALMAVAATGNVMSAALGMVLFGLGTVPSLFVVGLSAQGLLRRQGSLVRKAARGVMALNGMFLLIMAGGILLT